MRGEVTVRGMASGGGGGEGGAGMASKVPRKKPRKMTLFRRRKVS